MIHERRVGRFSLLLGVAACVIAAGEHPARAQALLCPTTVAGQTGFNLENGACTNGNTGAFSGASLATQALSDLSQSTTQETVRATTNAISERRTQEEQRCPAGFSRVGGACQPTDEQRRAERQAESERRPARRQTRRAAEAPETRRTARAEPAPEAQPTRRAARRTAEIPETRPPSRRAAPRAAEPPEPSPARRAPPRAAEAPEPPAPARRAAPRVAEVPEPAPSARQPIAWTRRAPEAQPVERPGPARVSKSAPGDPGYGVPQAGPYALPIPALIEPALRFGAWAHGFGDYERRSATGIATINCCTALGGGGIVNILDLKIDAQTRTGGFVGGLDLTARNLVSSDDGIIFGALTGYVASTLNVRTSSISRSPENVGNGFGHLRAHLSGPSAGVFATYFNGGFSTDFTLKVDFLDLDERFNDLLAFTANVINGVPFPPTTAPFSGGGSTRLTNTSVVSNANYRFPLSEIFWLEPTVGVNYTSTRYDDSAVLLGLDDGHVLRVQGGARFGAEFYVNDRARLTTTLTGLAFSNVDISGGFVAGLGPGANNDLLARADEGKLRGQAILALNLDLGNGVSTFVQGDVRGGDRFFGAGGRAGARIQW